MKMTQDEKIYEAAIREAKKAYAWMRCDRVRDRAGWHDYCERI